MKIGGNDKCQIKFRWTLTQTNEKYKCFGSNHYIWAEESQAKQVRLTVSI